MAVLGLPVLRSLGEPWTLNYIQTVEASALGHPHCTLTDHSPYTYPQPSPSLGTALWGSSQGPVSGFLHTASCRAGEVAGWRSSLPSTFLPLLSGFLPQSFARHIVASGTPGSAVPFGFLFYSAAWWPKWLSPFRGSCPADASTHGRLTAACGELWLPAASTTSCPTSPFSVTCGPCSAAPKPGCAAPTCSCYSGAAFTCQALPC